MERIVKFKATDGTEWRTEPEAQRRDELDAKVRAIEAELGPTVDRGRRQIDPAIYAKAKADVVELCRQQFPNEAVFKHDASEIHPMSFAGRLLSDVGGPLNRIWWRFSCVLDDYEYEQPFFALHPGEYERQEALKVGR